MRYRILTLLFIIIVTNNYAQTTNTFLTIDKLALQIPDSSTHSTESIANYITKNFTTATDKSRAVFIWIAQNIQYDINNMFAINFYKDKQQVINDVLEKRKGICMHYAELYNDI